MVDYGQAFKLPFTNLGRLGALFVLATLANFSDVVDAFHNDSIAASVQGAATFLLLYLLALIVSIAAAMAEEGYGIRIASSASQGRNVMPDFNKFPSLLLASLKFSVAGIIYLLPFLPVLLLSVVMIVGGVAVNSSWVIVFGIIILIPVVLVLLLLELYIMPMLKVHFAHENRFSAFFELRKILKYAFTRKFFVPWLACVGYAFGLFIPLFFLVMIIVIVVMLSEGAPFQAAKPFYLLIGIPLIGLWIAVLTPTTMNLLGQAYRDIAAASGKPVRTSSALKSVGKK